MAHIVQILALTTFWTLCNSDQNGFGSECEYKNDMCNVNPEKCIRRMKENGVLIDNCYGIIYGPGPLYETRGDTTFWIDIESYIRADYQPVENLTYTIYTKKGPRTDWSEPDSFTQVPGCCSMTLSDTCTLPKKELGETQYIFMPLAHDYYTGVHWYCKFELEQTPGEIKYCENDDQANCIEFVNGTVRIRNLFIPLSTELYSPTLDVCFFSPHNEYVDFENNTDSRRPYSAKEIEIQGTDDNLVANTSRGSFPCTLVEDVQGVDVFELATNHYQSGFGDFVCFVLRMKEADEFLKEARCNEQERYDTPKVESRIIIAVVVVICLSAIVLITAIGLIWLYKTYLIKLTFEKTMEELPDTLSPDKLEEQQFINGENTADGNLVPAKEMVDEITFLPCLPDGEVAPLDAERKAEPKLIDYDIIPNGNAIKIIVVADKDEEELSSSETPQIVDYGFHSGLAEPAEDHNANNIMNDNVCNNNDSGFSSTSYRSTEGSGISSPDFEPSEPQDFVNTITNGYTAKDFVSPKPPNRELLLTDDQIFEAQQDFSPRAGDSGIALTKTRLPSYVKQFSTDESNQLEPKIVTLPVLPGYVSKEIL